MSGGVGKVERPAKAHDVAYQAFPWLHPCQVNGVRGQALRGEQFHMAVALAHVERADFRHHRLGDDANHHVQARLDRSARGEGLTDLPEQAPLAPDGETGGRSWQWPLAAGGNPLPRWPFSRKG